MYILGERSFDYFNEDYFQLRKPKQLRKSRNPEDVEYDDDDDENDEDEGGEDILIEEDSEEPSTTFSTTDKEKNEIKEEMVHEKANLKKLKVFDEPGAHCKRVLGSFIILASSTFLLIYLM